MIWGFICLLVVWMSSIIKFVDVVIDVMEKIGDVLLYVLRLVNIFNDNDKLKVFLELFYGDIFDFYIIVLKFFSLFCKYICLLVLNIRYIFIIIRVGFCF